MLALTRSTASALPRENTLMTLISSGIAVSGARGSSRSASNKSANLCSLWLLRGP